MESQEQRGGPSKEIEHKILKLDQRIENLKIRYNLFFSGEEKLPPEKERNDLEKAIMALGETGSKSPRLALLVQNLISRFTLFNNIWMKRLNELEGGLVPSRKPKPKAPPAKAAPLKPKAEEATLLNVPVNVNNESSFDALYARYQQVLSRMSLPVAPKEKIIGALKTQMLTHNLPAAHIELSLKKGKVSFKLKK